MINNLMFRPSASNRWLNCPASPRVTRDAGPQETSPEAMRGIAAHRLGELGLLSNYKKGGALGVIDRTKNIDIVVDGFTEIVEVTQDIRDCAAYYATEAQRILKDYPVHMVEHQMKLSFIRLGVRGTADIVGIAPFSRLLIADYKSGMIPVKPDNPQLKLYALGALPLAKKNFAEECELRIIQEGGNPEDQSVIFTIEELEAWLEQEVKPAVAAALVPDASPVEGEWCRFCPGQKINRLCPAKERKARKALSKVRADPGEGLIPPKDMTAEQLSMALDLKKYINNWLDECKKEAKSRLKTEARDAPVNYTLTSGPRRRSWVADADKIENELISDLSYDEIYSTTLKSPSQIEALLKRKGRELPGYLVKYASGQAVKRVSGAKPGMPSIEEMFGE